MSHQRRMKSDDTDSLEHTTKTARFPDNVYTYVSRSTNMTVCVCVFPPAAWSPYSAGSLQWLPLSCFTKQTGWSVTYLCVSAPQTVISDLTETVFINLCQSQRYSSSRIQHCKGTHQSGSCCFHVSGEDGTYQLSYSWLQLSIEFLCLTDTWQNQQDFVIHQCVHSEALLHGSWWWAGCYSWADVLVKELPALNVNLFECVAFTLAGSTQLQVVLTYLPLPKALRYLQVQAVWVISAGLFQHHTACSRCLPCQRSHAVFGMLQRHNSLPSAVLWLSCPSHMYLIHMIHISFIKAFCTIP